MMKPLQQITSEQNPRLKRAANLKTSRGRKQQSRFIVYGEREVRRLVQTPFEIDELFVLADSPLATDHDWIPAAILERSGFALSSGPFEKLAYGARPDPIIATVHRPDRSLGHFPIAGDGFYLIVDQIEKPGNLGAVFRTADGSGCHGVLISNPQTDPFHPNSIRASMGTVFTVPFAIGDADSIRRQLRESGLPIYAATAEAARPYYELDFRNGAAVVLGNEADGLDDDWRQQTGIAIPMHGIADSLNVSVSAAVIAYENSRQRAKGAAGSSEDVLS